MFYEALCIELSIETKANSCSPKIEIIRRLVFVCPDYIPSAGEIVMSLIPEENLEDVTVWEE